jgi:DNA-binding SARP family transcriptional activator/predicted ATPase
MEVLKVLLLGSFQVMLGDRPLDRFDTDKVRALLAYLAVEGDRLQRREHLAGLLWPEHPQEGALRNLRLTLYRLRQTLDKAARQARLAISSPLLAFPDRQTVQFNPGGAVWLDVNEFERLWEASETHPHEALGTCPTCIERLRRAVSFYRGDFLEGFSLKDSYGFDEWVLLRRERLHRQAVDALDWLVEHFLAQTENAASAAQLAALENARAYAQRLLQIEPWRESAHRQLMQAMALSGQNQEALAQYEICRRILADEFGVEPDEATLQLYQQVRQRKIGRVVEPPTTPLPARKAPHNLPPQLAPLIGREAQLTRLNNLMFAYRWVTLVGEGGVGKTRLALAAAEAVLQHFPDGAWLVDLSEIGSEAMIEANSEVVRPLLAQAIAKVLEIPLDAGEPPQKQILKALRNRQLMLILDSFEHLSAAAEFILDIVTNAPGVTVLVTTRHFFYFQAGYMMRVDGLPVPDDPNDPQADQYSSVRLFVERVERLLGSFDLTPEALRYIIQICRLVEGSPLAIELAAPWAARLPLNVLAAAIQNDLLFLATKMTGILERHRSMRAVIDSSWRLLTPAEQKALERCTSLRGDFSVDEAVEKGTALAELEALVDKSLRVRPAPGQYRMHETLRQFVAEKVEELKNQPPGSGIG